MVGYSLEMEEVQVAEGKIPKIPNGRSCPLKQDIFSRPELINDNDQNNP